MGSPGRLLWQANLISAVLISQAFWLLLQGESPIAKTAAPPRRRQMRARVTSEEV